MAPEVPTLRIDHLNEAQKRAYVVADNRLAELAGWDKSLITIELQSLIDLDFNVELTGFSTAEIDLLIDGAGRPDAPDEADVISECDRRTPAVSRVGDLWQLGPHRLLCGDATRGDAYDKLLAGSTAQMVFTDPPYNVRIDGHVCGLGRIRHNEFVMGSGEMSVAEFTEFLTTVFAHLAACSADGSIHFICMDWRHMHEVLVAGQSVFAELKNLCVWNKDNGGMGAFYRSKHELVFAFKNGNAPHINNFGLGDTGRYRTNVWDYPGINTLRSGRMDELAMHPTVKPVAMIADAIRDCSKRRGMILDAFAGSGTTIIAAERTGRVGYAMDLDPKYVDVAIARWERLTGDAARHAETGQSITELAAARQVAQASLDDCEVEGS